MHDNCAKAKAPFEVLIQGPAGNRFVRSLLPSDLMNESNDPKKRSTISIFHPDENKDVFAYADSEADRKLMKRESETETPSKLAADEAKDAEATSTAAPEAAKSNESASTTEAPKKADQADAEHKVKRDSENEAKSESEAKSDSADDSNTTPADNSSTTEAATAKPAGEHKVKRDTATDLIENIAEIEAKAEAGESVLPEAAATEPTVGLALPVAPALLPLKAKIQALKTQLIGYKGKIVYNIFQMKISSIVSQILTNVLCDFQFQLQNSLQ